MQKTVITGLDLVRFSAAVLVWLFHVTCCTPSTGGEVAMEVGAWPPFLELHPLGLVANVGVPIFFVLSGFVIVYSAGGSAYDFFRSRAMRLWPGALVCATITAILMSANGVGPVETLVARWLRSIFFVPWGPYIDSVYWTLPIEITFYALVWFTLALGRRNHVETTIWLLLIVHAVYRAVRLSAGQGYLPPEVKTGVDFIVQWGFINAAPYFVLGSFLYFVKEKGLTLPRLMGCLLALVCGAANVRTTNLALVIWLIALAAIVASIYWNAQVSRVVPGGLARRLGIATYPFYLLHSQVGSLLALGLMQLGLNRWLVLGLSFAGILALSIAVSEVAEPRLRRLLSATLPKRTVPPAPAAPVTA